MNRPIMRTRRIGISDEAYQMLKTLKKPRENFTDVIMRITGGSTLLKLAGTMSNTQATSVKRRVKHIRAQSSQRIHSTADLGGRGSEHSNPTEMKRLLDRMRKEDA
jgi:predicted CopG family antitoxin